MDDIAVSRRSDRVKERKKRNRRGKAIEIRRRILLLYLITVVIAERFAIPSKK